MWPFTRRSQRSNGTSRSPRRGFRPRLEALEERWCPIGGVMEWADPLDPTFGYGGTVFNNTGSDSRALTDVKVLSDGRILAAGFVSNDFAAAQYNPDGTPDATFGSGGVMTIDFKGRGDEAAAVAVQPGTGGKILVAGTANTNHSVVFGVVRLNPNGTLDTTFGAKGSGGKVTAAPDARSANMAQSMAVFPDGRFVLAGITSTTPAGVGQIALARFNANGTPDTTFGNKGTVITAITAVRSPAEKEHGVNVALDGNGRLVVSATTPQNTQPGDSGDFLVARFNANGSLDTTFGAAGTGVVTTDLKAGGNGEDRALALTLQSDGKIVVAGWTTNNQPNTPLRAGVVRYNPDGSLDATFDGDGIATATWEVPTGEIGNSRPVGVAVQPDGKILLPAAGTLIIPNGDGGYNFTNLSLLMRLNADGSLDRSFEPSGIGVAAALFGPGGSVVTATALQPDGRVVLVGAAYDGSGHMSFAVSRLTGWAAAPSPVQVGSFAASSTTVGAGSSVTLTAGDITTSNAGATITKVAFYSIDSRGIEQFLGYGTQNADGTWTLTITADLALGSYTLLALAVDSEGDISDPFALGLEVV